MEIFYFKGYSDRSKKLKTIITILLLFSWMLFLSLLLKKSYLWPVLLGVIAVLNEITLAEAIYINEDDITIVNVFGIHFHFSNSEIKSFSRGTSRFHKNAICFFGMKKKCLPLVFRGRAEFSESTERLLSLLEERTNKKRGIF